MENPLFRNYWNATRPRFSPSSRPIPVRQQPQQSNPSHSPKVVSIPVHFVGSERTRLDAAAKIQKVFRGFVVRKNVKKIVKIRSEVEEIERRISQKEAADLIRSHAKERLRVNEMLMSLLFRLDSVRGVDSAVRDFRKVVIRKVILLQEAVDAIVVVAADAEKEENKETIATTDPATTSGNCETVADSIDQVLEMPDPAESLNRCNHLEMQDHVTADTVKAEKKETMADQTISTTDPAASSDNYETVADSVDQVLEMPDPVESLDKCNPESAAEQTLEMQDPVECPAVNAQTLETLQDPVGPVAAADDETSKIHDPAGSANDSRSPSIPVDDLALEAQDLEESKHNSVPTLDHEEKTGLLPSATRQCKKEEESQLEENVEEGDEMKIQGCEKRCEEEEEERAVAEIERMMEENEKLKGLVSELCERNAVQSRLMNALSQRVEELERAVTRSERIRRRNKRRAAKIERDVERRKCERRL